MPQRIQRRRTKGWRKPEGAVIVSRGTDWGNPFRVGSTVRSEDDIAAYVDRRLAVELFHAYVLHRGWVPQIRDELAGYDLVCWCPLDGGPCHADVLLELANGRWP